VRRSWPRLEGSRMTIAPFACAPSGLTWMICGPSLPDPGAVAPEGGGLADGFVTATAAGFAGSGLETTISGVWRKGRGLSAMPPAIATMARDATVVATALREIRSL